MTVATLRTQPRRSNNDKTFQRYVVVPENHLAYQAARQLANRIVTGKRGASLYLHGAPGTGKTHLLHALANEVLTHAPQLTAQIVAAQELRIPDPDSHYEWSDCDLLIFEDLQHLSPQSSEWLVQTLDHRLAHDLVTVFSGKKGPQQLPGHNCRLTSRLGGCLVVGLEPLAAPSRLKLLAQLAQRRQLAVSSSLLRWLAERIHGTGRQLEGVIQQLTQLSTLHEGPLTDDHIEEYFAGNQVSLDRIVRKVSDTYSIDARRLRSRRRGQSALMPRQVAMYLARRLTPLTLGEIGQSFGGRDHTTVLHAYRKVERALSQDTGLCRIVRQLQADLA